MSRQKFLCLDCKVDTGKISEHYYVQNEIWLKVVGSNKGMLCIGCLEKRIGRQLNHNDFVDCHINNPKLYPMSLRLLSRIKTPD